MARFHGRIQDQPDQAQNNTTVALQVCRHYLNPLTQRQCSVLSLCVSTTHYHGALILDRVFVSNTMFRALAVRQLVRP